MILNKIFNHRGRRDTEKDFPSGGWNLYYRRLLAPLRLDFDENVHQGHCRWSDSRNTRSMAQSPGTDSDQRLLYLARQATHRTIVEPLRNGVLLGFLQPLDGALLLQQIAGVLDFRLGGLQFVSGC